MCNCGWFAPDTSPSFQPVFNLINAQLHGEPLVSHQLHQHLHVQRLWSSKPHCSDIKFHGRLHLPELVSHYDYMIQGDTVIQGAQPETITFYFWMIPQSLVALHVSSSTQFTDSELPFAKWKREERILLYTYGCETWSVGERTWMNGGWERGARQDLGIDGVSRIHLAQDTDQLRTLVNDVMNFRFHKRREFLGQLSDCQLPKNGSASRSQPENCIARRNSPICILLVREMKLRMWRGVRDFTGVRHWSESWAKGNQSTHFNIILPLSPTWSFLRRVGETFVSPMEADRSSGSS